MLKTCSAAPRGRVNKDSEQESEHVHSEPRFFWSEQSEQEYIQFLGSSYTTDIYTYSGNGSLGSGSLFTTYKVYGDLVHSVHSAVQQNG